jgi:diguanylate cyclase (GGDEF)-like protein
MCKLACKISFFLIFCMAISLTAQAEPKRLDGIWYQVSLPDSARPNNGFLEKPLNVTYPPSKNIHLTGGHYLHIAPIHVDQLNNYVLDFKNTSTIGKFRHQIYDTQHKLLLSLEGGIESNAYNPFFLRHGREFTLAKGDYILATELISDNYLALPEPYLDDRLHYQQAIKKTNTITLMGLGVFLGLGIYYAALAMSRNRWAEAMYAVFILGNFVFNGAALLLLSDMFGVHSILLVSMPVLFSNIAYVVFVMHLLEIQKATKKRLYWLGAAMIAVMSLFLGFAMMYTNWALELSRYGVTLFLSYGLLAAIVECLKKNATAKRYLVAISLFFVMGFITVSLGKLDNQFTLYIEHMGLVSVAIEVVLLALVLAFQFSELHNDKRRALEELEVSEKTAHSDALTGLPNRHALGKDITKLPVYGCLAFIDLDGLKFYNDTYGHARGDDLLCCFASSYQDCLGVHTSLYRLGGDEFAVVDQKGDVLTIQQALERALLSMKANGFEFAGASIGVVHGYEADNTTALMRVADGRMYDNKRARKMAKENDIKNSIAFVH